jgi:hypothetical protein
MASEESPMHDNDVPPTIPISPSHNELLVQGTDGGGPPHCVLFPSGIDGIDTEGNTPGPNLETLTCSMQLLSAYKRLPPIRCLHPNHGNCSNHRQVCLKDRCTSSLPCIQRSLLQILPHMFEPPILRKAKMISSMLACSLSKGIMPHWHQKWPCRKAMSLLKRPILLLLNKVAPPVTCNQCMKPSLQEIHPRLPCKWFPPPFLPMPPRDQSLRMLLKAAWVLLPPSLPT